MLQHYLLLKSLHIFGVILFLGNIIVTGFWKVYADKSKDWQIISFSQRLVSYTDIFFTTLGVLIIIVTGLLMAKNYGDYWRIKWIAWGLGLFIASGIIWVVVLIPMQVVLHRMTNQFVDTKTVPLQYWMYEKIWLIFGVAATVLPLFNLYWMVFKPT
jgi:uncharacterized membrane protein